jgi:hypothetical protein
MMTPPTESPDYLHFVMLEHFSGGRRHEGIEAATRLVELLRAGSVLPMTLASPGSMGGFRELCARFGLDDPLPGRCPRCSGGGCYQCGKQGYIN